MRFASTTPGMRQRAHGNTRYGCTCKILLISSGRELKYLFTKGKPATIVTPHKIFFIIAAFEYGEIFNGRQIM